MEDALLLLLLLSVVQTTLESLVMGLIAGVVVVLEYKEGMTVVFSTGLKVIVVQGFPLPSVKVITFPVSIIVTVTEASGLVEVDTVKGSPVNEPMFSGQIVVRTGKQEDT